MYSLKFPNMLNSSSTNVVKDHDATLSNLKLILQSARNTLFGDPYYGNDLQKVIFSQNNAILQDLVVDEIYTCIQTFMPQISLSRDDITVYGEGTDLYADIKCINLIDYTVDLYTIRLTDTEE